MARKLALVVVVVVGVVVVLALVRRLTEVRVEEPSATTPVVANASLDRVEPRAPLDAAPETSSTRTVDDAVPTEPAASALASLVVVVRAKEDGRALEGMPVHLADPKAGGRVEGGGGARGVLGNSLATDSSGRVEFEVQPGIATELNVGSLGAGTSMERRKLDAFAAGEKRELDVLLATRDDARVCVRVLERESRTPLADVRVLAGSDKEAKLRTDRDGRVEIPFATWKPARLRFLLEGFAEARMHGVPDHATPEKALEVLLDRGATVSVRLEGAPEGAWTDYAVTLQTDAYRLEQHEDLWNGMETGPAFWRGRCDAAGRTSIADLPAGTPLRVDAYRAKTKARTLPEPLVLRAGETRELVIPFAAGCRVRGRAIDTAHVPVSDLEMWLLPGEEPRLTLQPHEAPNVVARARTDDGGRFTFEHVGAGSWRIGPAASYPKRDAEHAMDAVTPIATLVNVAKDDTEREIELVLHRGLYVRGVVRMPDGSPAKRASVDGSRGDHDSSVQAREDGTFVLGPLVSGTYAVEAESMLDRDCAPSESVNVEAGATNVVLQLRRGARISGRIVDAATNEGTKAELLYQSGTDPNLHMTQTRPDGSFELGGLLPGTVSIVASTSDGRIAASTPITLVAGDAVKDVVVSLERGARVTVAFEGTSRFGSAWFAKDGRCVTTDGVERGTKHTFTVPPGKVRLEFRIFEKDKRIVRDLDLAAGEEREVTVREDE